MYINKNNLLKYLVQFTIVTMFSYTLSPCKVNYNFAILLGLISSSLFALIDNYYPIIVYEKNIDDGDIYQLLTIFN